MRNRKLSSLAIALIIPLAATFSLSGCARTTQKHAKKKTSHITRTAKPIKKYSKKRIRKSDRVTTASLSKLPVQKIETRKKAQFKPQKLDIAMVKTADNHASPLTTASTIKFSRGYSAFKGQWNISVAGETCHLVLQMAGNHKSRTAATSDCATPMLTNISSWTLEDKKLLLKSSGTIVATLYPMGPSRFDGETAYSQSINIQKP